MEDAATKGVQRGPMPNGFERWNRALRGVYLRGQNDAVEGRDECPYSDARTYRGSVTWSRAYRRAWQDGHDDQRKFMNITEFYQDKQRNHNTRSCNE